MVLCSLWCDFFGLKLSHLIFLTVNFPQSGEVLLLLAQIPSNSENNIRREYIKYSGKQQFWSILRYFGKAYLNINRVFIINQTYQLFYSSKGVLPQFKQIDIVPYLSLCAWLISLGKVFSRFLHISISVVCVRISFLQGWVIFYYM